MSELQNNLPPGWECKYDGNAGKYYYINHYTKSTTWEDPRLRHRPLQGTPKHFQNIHTEYIPLQHGSPELRRNYVYPSEPSPMPAFQMSASPKMFHHQDFRNTSKTSPLLTVRTSKVQESHLATTSDTEDAVSKISAMFPTVSETHIKLLLKKYLNREALVISALKVEKHPITTPGPFATPPPQRNIFVTPPLGHRSSPKWGVAPLRGGSDGVRNSPRSQSSPKLKLRYMKSVFPEADENIILEVLQNHDNNIQKTSEKLKDMGFNKKDTVKIAQQKAEIKAEETRQTEEAKEQTTVVVEVKLKTNEEKAQLKEKLGKQYEDVAEHLITIALESVNFDENRANQILQIMIQEDTEEANKNKKKTEEKKVTQTDSSPPTNALPVSQSRQSIKSLLTREKTERDQNVFKRVIEENESKYLINTSGHNPKFSNGPDDRNLIKDYVMWQGPDSGLRKGSRGLAKGPNKGLLSNRTYKACGPNSELQKGPKLGLAKGSILTQLKTVLVGESRGK